MGSRAEDAVATPINFPENPAESMNCNADFLKLE
jgi:hypothetical protein